MYDGIRMSDEFTRDAQTDWQESPFAGLMPSRLRLQATQPMRPVTREHSALARNLRTTMPIVLVGSLALSTLGLGATTDASARRPAHDPKSDTSDLTKAVRDAVATIAARPAPVAEVSAPKAEIELEAIAVPAHYTVKHGDTVSEIAGRYRLATASILALNGLGWKSLIFPGQVLRLSKATVKPPAARPPVVTPPRSKAPVVIAPAATSSASNATSAIKYTIKSGDTLTSIAKAHKVTVAAVLAANRLSASSVIYAGRTLIIPAIAPVITAPIGTNPAQVGAVIVPLSPEMKTNAKTIIAVGRQLKVPDFGIIIALSAAAQESGLRNLTGGDKDSIGLFQQRPSTGWGTVAQLENTAYASELFYGGPSNPNKGNTRGLLDIKGWQSMTLTQAAQAVEISGNPTAYAKWQASATAWLAELG
jgi:LysM repeat protein